MAGTQKTVVDELRMGPARKIAGGINLIPIVRMTAAAAIGARAAWGTLIPLAVVLISSGKEIAVLRMDGETDPLEPWLARVPDLVRYLSEQ